MVLYHVISPDPDGRTEYGELQYLQQATFVMQNKSRDPLGT